jgi:hypothetical protein
MILQLVALIILGLMCGSELNVAAFSHPALSRQSLETHIRLRASFASLFGRVMPYWMIGSTLLNLLLLFPFARLSEPARRLAAVAFAIQVLACLFSLIGPVPINNRIAGWRSDALPRDWHIQEHRWDVYHWLRTAGLIVSFTILALSMGMH